MENGKWFHKFFGSQEPINLLEKIAWFELKRINSNLILLNKAKRNVLLVNGYVELRHKQVQTSEHHNFYSTIWGGFYYLPANLFTIPARQKGKKKWSTAWLAHSSGTSTQSIYDTDIKDYYDYKFILYGSLKCAWRLGEDSLFCCIECTWGTLYLDEGCGCVIIIKI